MIQKTKVITLMVFGLLFLNLSGQEEAYSNDPVAKMADENRKFRLGLQFSPNLAWLTTNTAGYESEGSKMGFCYGLSFESFLTKNYLVSTGLFMQQLGGKLSYKGTTADFIPANVEESYRLKYIEIPFALKLRTNEIGYLTYYGQFGFKAGFNYSSSADYAYTYDLNGTTFFPGVGSYSSDDVKDEVNWMNLSLVVGAGVEYSISGNTALMIGITYNNGFINQLDTKTNVLDEAGNALIDGDGNPIYSKKNAHANLNYFSLNIGIYF